jgi:hypothetical protein
VQAAGHGCHIFESIGKVTQTIGCGQVSVCFFDSQVQHDKLLVLKKTVCLSQLVLVGVVQVIVSRDFNGQEAVIHLVLSWAEPGETCLTNCAWVSSWTR